MAFRFAFKRSRRDSVEGLIGRESFLTPSSLLYPYPASGLIVLRRINYHLLSATAEARTKREALVFWKRNLLVARCATHRPPDAEGHNAPPGFAPRRRQQWPPQQRDVDVATPRSSCLLEIDFAEISV